MNSKIEMEVESWSYTKECVTCYLNINNSDHYLKISHPKFQTWLVANNKLNVPSVVKLNYFEDMSEAFIKKDLESYLKAYHLTELLAIDFETKTSSLDTHN